MSILSIIICTRINYAGIDGGGDSDHCVVTILLLIVSGTVLFGFIQVCEVYAPQTAEQLRNVQRPALQSFAMT